MWNYFIEDMRHQSGLFSGSFGVELAKWKGRVTELQEVVRKLRRERRELIYQVKARLERSEGDRDA